MKPTFTLLLAAFLCGGLSLAAQSTTNPGIELTPQAVDYPSADLDQSFKAYEVFTMDHEGLNASAAKSVDLSFDLELSARERWRIDLEPLTLFAPDFRFRVLTETGIEYQQAPTNAVFRGRAKGTETGTVLMTVWEDYFVLSIRSDTEERFIEPLHKMIPGAAKNLYVSYRAADVLVDPALKCGLTETAEHHDQLPTDFVPPTGGDKMMCDVVFAELALAAAFDMVQKFGTVAATQQHIVDITVQMTGLYAAEEINYQVVDIVIPNSLAADPWSKEAFMDVLLPDFAAWGNTAGNFVTHDIGQLWVARDVFRQANEDDPDDNPNGLIGRADGIGVVCTQDRYNVCEDFANSMNCLRSLSAHEIGHLWGGVHGDAVEDVTIMSAFIVCDATNFTAANSANFAGHVASRTCLTSANVVPPVAMCQDINRLLDANGNVTITPGDIDNGSTFSCGPSSLSLDVDAFDCGDVGGNTVELTISDLNGLSASCTATVTVADNLAPSLVCRDTTVALDATGMNSFDGSILGTTDDNCSSTIDPLPLAFDCDDAGVNFIFFLDASDPSGNDNTCQINVSVIDNLPPTIACRDTTVALGITGMNSFDGSILGTTEDNCSSSIAPLPLSFDCDDAGETLSYFLVASDPSGNEATCQINVGVIDTIPPVVVGADQTITLDDQGMASVDSAAIVVSATDNCEVVAVTFSRSLDFGCEDIGEQEVILTAIDPSGNVGMDTVTVTVLFEEPDLGCIGEINVTLDDECGFELVFSQVLAGNVVCLELVEWDIVVQDEDPSNGPIIDGCGRFIYTITEIENPDGPIVLENFTTCWGYVNAEDKTPPAIVSTPDDVDLLCVDLDENNLTTLPFDVSKCYRVSSATGATVPGSMAPALRARLLAGGTTPLVPTFTDGCTSEIEVCVNDVVTFGDDPSCDDVVITRTFTATEVEICTSASDEVNESVVTSFELTFERPTLADLSADNIDALVEYELCGTANPTRADYPAPRPGDFPFLAVGERTFPLQNGAAVCNIGVTFSDGDPIVTCPFTYKFVRTYTVIDWCDPGDIRTFTQVVKVGDTTAPVFTGPGAPTNAAGDLVFGTNAGNICAAYLRLDDVSAIDNCSGTNVSISAAIYPGGNLNGTPIGSFDVVPGGTPELSSAIPAGRHLLRYTYEDECGNGDVEDFFFVVEDQTPPVAICEDGLNISIAGGANNGFAVLTPANIDAGSYDDCSAITRAIARVNANDLAIGGYSDQITLTCADIGTVRVGLRVTDALGNENFCWLDVLVEDKLVPTCIAPADLAITCDEYNTTLPADIMDASNETLDALFGAAAGVDNCGVTITQSISGDVNSCGVGSFVRTFVATDDAGFTNSNSCRQNIRVDGVHDYRLTFPTDESSDCAIVPEYDGIMAEELACDLITTTTDVDTLRTLDAGDECFKLRITYDVVNWCEYNSFGEPYLVPRDGDGVNNRQRLPRDLEADVLYLNVLPGATTTTTDDDRAFMTLFTDRVYSPNAPQRDQPVDDNLLSDGDDNDYGDNDVDSRGFFRYVQFVKIYDEVAPEITFTEPAECFAGNNEDCSGTVILEFVATDACSDVLVEVELDADYVVTTGFEFTANVEASDDGEGNFTVNLSNIPAGEHAIRVRASDGCGNFDVQIIEFCVTPDRTPTPICIQTLTVTLMDDGNGGGIAAIWASDFIASPIVDCFGEPVTNYSIFRTLEAADDEFTPGFNPPVTNGIEDITCADVGDLSVRVYAFDDNGSTPDFCEVVVEVQDNEPWCGGSTGSLSGLVLTPAEEAIAGVLMILTGGMDATTITDENGAFEFRNVAFGGDYTVQPSYAAPFSNRDVKTSDLVQAIGEILGTQSFDSPYDYIAADVNRDGEHDVRDVVISSRAILGITNGYPLGNWSFATTEAVIDMANPYGEAFPEVYNVNNLQGSFRDADFVGIMMGDLVDGDGRSAQTLRTEDVRLEAGQTHTVVLDGAHLAGFQGTIELAAGLELVSADYAGEGGMNLNRAAEGLIAVALRNEASLTLEVRATEAGVLSELIGLSDAIAVREGVAANGTSNGLNLAFNGSALAPATALNALYQNTPNPVMDMTMISFELAQAGAATLTVQDAAGRLILTRQLEAVAGLNRVELMDIKATGVLTYTLTSGDFIASRKMVVVK